MLLPCRLLCKVLCIRWCLLAVPSLIWQRGISRSTDTLCWIYKNDSTCWRPGTKKNGIEWCLEFFEESSRFVTFRLKNDSIEWRGKKKTKKPHLKWNVCVHHVFHCIRINVEVKILRDFLLFFSIIQGHRCINRFDFQLQPAFKKIFRRYSPFFLSLDLLSPQVFDLSRCFICSSNQSRCVLIRLVMVYRLVELDNQWVRSIFLLLHWIS